jgi:hypothetical protein
MGSMEKTLMASMRLLISFGKSVINYALMSEGLLRDLMNFRIGTEIIGSYMPLT